MIGGQHAEGGEELLPCPFCGNEADDDQGFHDLTVIGCSVCETAQTRPFENRDEAVKVWNGRTNGVQSVESESTEPPGNRPAKVFPKIIPKKCGHSS